MALYTPLSIDGCLVISILKLSLLLIVTVLISLFSPVRYLSPYVFPFSPLFLSRLLLKVERTIWSAGRSRPCRALHRTKVITYGPD
jgi:hypothetical protein